MRSYGMVINSFEELEQEYVNEYKKLKRGKVWCIGPLSLCNDSEKHMAHRRKSDSIYEQEILEWLDSRPHGSVVYACLGSISRVTPVQLIELGFALEASNHPFIWVIRAGDRAKEVEEWIIESGSEERVIGKGFFIRGWAPQVLILSHPSIGGFLTHCGWNSTIEGVSAGRAHEWPQFSEQFLNEKLVVQFLGVGAEFVVHWGEEEKFGVSVKSEDVKEAIQKVMDLGIEGVKRRKKATELGKIANGTIKEGGSSYMNLKLLIQDIREHASRDIRRYRSKALVTLRLFTRHVTLKFIRLANLQTVPCFILFLKVM
ncbi:UDP-glucuronosyl/UDP-glucosyltransferase [Artemisia annua]|uniref:UDP-glucuronosyl/UDP-glucosyltransferase n=1 Tax=Artemisia annua TaxID=35608 RepID=A0A2U1L3Q1_ARTAN|nr:UDP-glucuronosyl/UDP-glucosyltransferase [Artemisia annua]